MATLSNLARTFFLIRADRVHDLVFETKKMPEGTTDIVGFNLAPVKSINNTTVSSSTWTTDDANVTLSSPTNDTITTQVTVAANSAGRALLKNTITMSDSQIIVRYIEINVFKINLSKDYPV